MKSSISLRPSNQGYLARATRFLGLKMAWNEPGNNKGDKDPWGGGNNQDGPPDLDEVVRNMQKKFGGLFNGKGKKGNGQGGSGEPSPFGFYAVVFGVLAVMWLALDMTYTIQQAERGVVLRFGK